MISNQSCRRELRCDSAGRKAWRHRIRSTRITLSIRLFAGSQLLLGSAISVSEKTAAGQARSRDVDADAIREVNSMSELVFHDRDQCLIQTQAIDKFISLCFRNIKRT